MFNLKFVFLENKGSSRLFIIRIVLGYVCIIRIVLGYVCIIRIVLGYVDIIGIVLGCVCIIRVVLGYADIIRIVLGYAYKGSYYFLNQVANITFSIVPHITIYYSCL